jgi:uncharacterized protein
MPYRRVDGLLNFSHFHKRPPDEERLFVSEKIESVIRDVSKSITDKETRTMFQQCFPNTLDTTVYYSENDDGSEPDTFITTGDIPAMWLRDSVGQVWPYLQFITDDPDLKNMFIGLIRRQTHCLIRDSYANGFERDYGIWERKWELDSIGYFLRLCAGYYTETQDLIPFDSDWLKVINILITMLHLEQNTLHKENLDLMFQFKTKSGHLHPAIRMEGYGYPGKQCGLVRCLFRPSDDECVFPYLIPANAMILVGLRAILPILRALPADDAAKVTETLANYIERGLTDWGVIEHPKHGKMYAYEVDGFGSHYIMDDPNIPSLLSLPYLGFCSQDDPVYKNTRKMILSTWNPFYAVGKKAEGITSPHVGTVDQFWPMATIMQALTSSDEEEITECLRTLKETHGGTCFMHESVHVDNPDHYSRHWFAWTNSLFGELILNIYEKYPEILKNKLS